MKTRRIALLASTALLAAVALSHVAAPGPVSPPQRAIAVTFSVDGEVVLRGGTGDDGTPDADAVWDGAERIDLSPTEAFAKLDVPEDSEDLTLGWLRGKATEHLGEPPLLELAVGYGGETRLATAKLVRTPGGDRWRIHPDTLEGYFSIRSISRREASLLRDPKRRR